MARPSRFRPLPRRTALRNPRLRGALPRRPLPLSTDDRARYVGAHAAARAILARYLAAAPSAVPFSILPSGKPVLSSPHSDWRFNLSHSGRASLIVVARSLDVGADIESVNPSFPFVEIASRFFSPREASAVSSAPPSARADLFYRLWTSKEACLKATGRGLSGLDDLNLLGPSGLSIFPLPAPSPYIASLACVGTPTTLRLFLLPDSWLPL